MSWFPRYSIEFPYIPTTGRVDLPAGRIPQLEFGDTRTCVSWFKFKAGNLTNGCLFFGLDTNIHYNIGILMGTETQIYSRWRNAAFGVALALSQPALVREAYWHMMTERFSTTGPTVVCEHFLDGRQIGYYTDNDGFSGAFAGNWNLGQVALGNSSGLISGCAIYRALLTDRQIMDLHRGQVRPQDLPNCVSFWPFQEGAGALVEDIVGGINGTFAGLGESWTHEVPT